jgi:replicative DNA helicase
MTANPSNRNDCIAHVNVDLEQEVLAALLACPAEIARVQPILSPEHFYEELHRRTYAAMLDIAAAEGLPTEGQLYQRLGPRISETVVANGVNVQQYLARLARIGGLPGAPLLTHARTVHALYCLRQFEALGVEVQQAQGYDPRAFLSDCFEKTDEIRALCMDRHTHTATMAEAGRALMERIQADLKGERRALATTGITRFDDEIGGGLRPASLITLAARTAMGKSIFGLEAMYSAARQGFGCVYHSLEMSREQVMSRLASSSLEHKGIKLPFAQILKPGGLTMHEAERVMDAMRDIERLNAVIEDGGGRTIQEIAVSSERLMDAFVRKGIAPGPVVIDHAHIVRPSRRFNREDEGLKEVADGALALAKRLDVPVLLLAQCNRNTEGRDDKRPSLADVRGAGAFEENSDAVVFLYRPAYYIERSAKFRDGDLMALNDFENAKHALEIIIDKNRAGRSNHVVKAWIDVALNAIRNK